MIDPLGPTTTPARAQSTPRAGAAGFRVPARSTSSAGVGEAAATAGTSLLALQEDPPDRRRDRQAQQGTEALLAELSALHRGLLAGDGGEAVLDRAESLLAAMPPAHDPALAAIQRQVTLRVRIEQARRGR